MVDNELEPFGYTAIDGRMACNDRASSSDESMNAPVSLSGSLAADSSGLTVVQNRR